MSRWLSTTLAWVALCGIVSISTQAQAQVVGEVNFQSISPPASSVMITSGTTATVSVSGTVAATMSSDTIVLVSVLDGNTTVAQQSYQARINSKTDYVYNDPANFAFSVPLGAGKHTVSVVVATYNGGGGTLTYPVTVTSSTPFAVSFSSPSADQTVTATNNTSVRVSIAGTATPPTSAITVTNLALLDNGTQINHVGPGLTGAALNISAAVDLAVGTHTLTLNATDSGGETTSATRTIKVVASSTPTPTPTPTPTTPNIAQIMSIITDLLLSDDPAPTPPPATNPPPGPDTSSTPIAVAVTPNELSYSDAGTLPGTFGVDNSGAATYGIELAVPPGTAGMQPKLSLGYSSNDSNGMVGLGWSLGGFSTIHRCPRTIAQDGSVGRIGFDGADRLCLDGMRLLRYDGTPGTDTNTAYWANSNGAQYRTEIEGFARITRLANGGFKVELKDGRIQYYGIDSNSAIGATGRTDGQPLLWALARTEDRSGNYMTFEYSWNSTTGEYLPTQIRYGGNTAANQNADLAVRFSYEDRPDAQIQYMGGARNDLRKRLTDVITYIGTNADGTGGTRVRDYIVRYRSSANSARSLVDSVQVCAATDSECLPKTSMTWGSNPLKLTEKKAWKETVNGDNENIEVKVVSGDFTGNGFTVFLYPQPGQAVCPTCSGNAGQLRPFTGFLYGQEYEGKVTLPATSDKFSEVMAADLDGDGRDDLVFIDVTSRNWAYCLSLPSNGPDLNFSTCQLGPEPLPPKRIHRTNPDDLPYFVSLRNDGKAQLVAFTSQQVKVCSYANSTMSCSVTGLIMPTSNPVFDLTPLNLSKQGMAGFYGVWKDEALSRTGVTLCNFLGNTLTCKNLDNVTGADTTNPADFNGDGLTDFVASPGSGAPMHVCLSTETDVDCNSMSSDNTYVGQHYLMPGVGDYTGSGINYFASANGDPTKAVALGVCHIIDGTSVCKPEDVNVIPDHVNQFHYPASDSAAPALIDTSGVPGFRYCSIPYYESNQFFEDCITYTAMLPANEDKLIAVVNGVGQREEIDYARGDDNAVYSRFATVNGVEQRPVYPQLSDNPGVLVKQLRRSNGQGGWLSSSYSYAGAMRDGFGRGSLGFKTMRVTDANGITSDSTFAQNFPLIGFATRVIRSKGLCSLEDVMNTPEVQSFDLPAGGQSFFVDTKQVDVTRRDLDCSDLGTVQTLNQYSDSWGNLNTQMITTKGNNETFVTKTVSVFNTSSGKNYLSGLPTSVAVTKTNSTNTSLTRTVGYSYNSTTGLRDTETVEPSNPKYTVVTTYDRSRNSFGLVNKQVQTWTNPACADATWPSSLDGPCTSAMSRTVSDVTYDTKGRFPVSVKNALGHTETRVYDARSGSITQRIDANSLRTTWSVNGFGRVTVELGPDGNETRNYVKACAGNCPNGAAVVQVVDRFNGLNRISTPNVSYLDSAGHLVRTVEWGFDGKQIITDQRYDTLGRLWEVDWPRFGTDLAYLATRRGYDDLNRVVTMTSVDEAGVQRTATTDYYGFRTVQKNLRSQVRTEWHDVLGQLRQVDDSNSPIGTTKFEYDPFGNLVKTTDPSQNIIMVIYDQLGRKTDLQDPDLGWIHYDVDPMGQVWAQTSPNERAKTQKTYLAYDLLGRMTARYEPDLVSHWVYDSATTGVGQLALAYTKVGSTTDYSRTHTYDASGRPKSTSTVLFDGTYTSQVEYDAWGRIITNAYQHGSDPVKSFGSRYNAYGYLSRIERGSLVLWQVSGADAAKRPTTVALGNGLKQTKTFYPQTGRVQSVTLATSANVGRLQEGYTYDQLGNVTQRTQFWDAGGFIEDLTYDALNRLQTSQVQGKAVQTFLYDATGNITSKTGTGTYTYPTQGAGAIRPHALRTISSLSGTFDYDDDGNMRSSPNLSATWTSFDMPLQIAKGSVNSTFVYGPEHQRVRQDRSDGTVIVYAGAQEVEKKGGVVTVKTYWPAGIGVEIDRGTTSTEMNWVHVDRIGSVVAVTDQNGAIREKLEYDVWGKRRSTVDNNSTTDSIDGQTDNRGFTGHEMLDQLDLVHMNGRVYDPFIGRFASGDAFVADVVNGQNYNRYSYVSNNPTNLTDPTGFVETPIGTYIAGGGGFAKTECSGTCGAYRFDFDPSAAEEVMPSPVSAANLGRTINSAQGSPANTILAREPTTTTNAPQLGNAADGYTEAQQVVIRGALQRQQELAARMSHALSRWNAEDQADFVRHFGAITDAKLQRLRNIAAREKSVGRSLSVSNFKPATKTILGGYREPATVFAVVPKPGEHIIYLGGLFWSASPEVQGITVFHEISHFSDVALSQDRFGQFESGVTVNSPALIERLRKFDESLLIWNAYSIENYVSGMRK